MFLEYVTAAAVNSRRYKRFFSRYKKQLEYILTVTLVIPVGPAKQFSE